MNTKRIQRFFLSGSLEKLEDQEQINQIVRVLRLREGDRIVGIKDEREFLLEIRQISTSKISSIDCKIISQCEKSKGKELDFNLRVFLPLLKGEKLDWVLQKCTELGVQEFQFVEFENAVKENKNIEHKTKRWHKILTEAAEQSERVKIPVIHETIAFSKAALRDQEIGFAFLERLEEQYPLLLNKSEKLYPEIQPLNAPLKLPIERGLGGNLMRESTNFLLSQNARNKAAIFGPEGGFSEAEKEIILSKNFLPISLGKRILRSETAIIHGVGLIGFLGEE